MLVSEDPGAAVAAATRIDVTILMPCLNEAGCLPFVIDNANQAVRRLQCDLGLNAEILLSDNGSTDGSQATAEALGARVIHAPQRGYGAALIAGIRAARGRFILMADCDGSYDFTEGVACVARLADGYDLCMGSRLRGRIEPGAMPWKNRFIGNPALTFILNAIFRSGLSDAHCGLRAFTRDAFERMRLTSTGMEFASEMVLKASLLGLRRTEEPVTLRRDRRSRPPHLRPWRDGWRHLRYLLMLSPSWIYEIPAACFAFFGTVLMAILEPVKSGHSVHIGSIKIGDHWMVIASALLTLAHLAAFFGVIGELYGIREGYRVPSRAWLRAFRLLRLENCLLAGGACIAVGLGGMIELVADWVEADDPHFFRIRSLILFVTLLVLGVQTVFGGFMIAIVGGNNADGPKALGVTAGPKP
jgi:glycosyltransferase involved in cell wall biosynthesis